MTGRSLAHKVFRQYVGRTLSGALIVTIGVYFLGIPALTLPCAVATVLVALWWAHYLFYGPPRRTQR